VIQLRIVRFENGEFLVSVFEDGIEKLKTVQPEDLQGYTLIPPEAPDPVTMQRVLDWEWACGPLPERPNRHCIACIWDRFLTTSTGKTEAHRRPGDTHTCLRNHPNPNIRPN
jgi:hypothetical protein